MFIVDPTVPDDGVFFTQSREGAKEKLSSMMPQ